MNPRRKLDKGVGIRFVRDVNAVHDDLLDGKGKKINQTELQATMLFQKGQNIKI